MNEGLHFTDDGDWMLMVSGVRQTLFYTMTGDQYDADHWTAEDWEEFTADGFDRACVAEHMEMLA